MVEPVGSSTITPNPMRGTTTPCSPPSFKKNICSFIMRNDALELPATKHGLNLQQVVKLQGPSGQTTSVHLRVTSHGGQDRMYFRGAEWRAFLVENGFKVGHLLVFSLVSKSTFSMGLLENSASPAPINKHSVSVEQRFNISNSSARTERRSSTRPSGNEKNEVVYTKGTLKYKPSIEALLENLQCPHFVAVMQRSNLYDSRSCALYVPAKFLEMYGQYLTQVHILRGPSRGLVEVRFTDSQLGGMLSTKKTAFDWAMCYSSLFKPLRVGLSKWLKMDARRTRELENCAAGVTLISRGCHILSKAIFSKFSLDDQEKLHVCIQPTLFHISGTLVELVLNP